jgi:hypothetical protein
VLYARARLIRKFDAFLFTVNPLFTFQAHIFGDKRSAPVVIKASREWLEQFIPLREFAELFGGYALWRAPQQQTDEMPGEALGVWGRRNASKMRRVLRERGALFTVVQGEGPRQQLAILNQDWTGRL